MLTNLYQTRTIKVVYTIKKMIADTQKMLLADITHFELSQPGSMVGLLWHGSIEDTLLCCSFYGTDLSFLLSVIVFVNPRKINDTVQLLVFNFDWMDEVVICLIRNSLDFINFLMQFDIWIITQNYFIVFDWLYWLNL